MNPFAIKFGIALFIAVALVAFQVTQLKERVAALEARCSDVCELTP